MQFLFHGNGEMRAVVLKKYYLPNSPTSIKHSQFPQNFQGSRGKIKNDLIKMSLKNFNSDGAN